jgi:dienelactone hydrolase
MRILPFLVTVFFAISAEAAIKSERIEYKAGATVMEGYVAYDDASTAKRPGVVVVHDWMGLAPITEQRANELAAQGYVAFAADIYGKGVRPKTPQEAGALAGKYKSDRKLLRERVRAAYDALSKFRLTDTTRLAAIGFCFGGTTALELARSGAPLKAVVTFHGGLDSPTPADGKNITAKVLVLHGADDPHVPPADIAAFKKELDDAKVDWQMVEYSGTVHSFTIPTAGNDPSKGQAYNERSAKRAFQAEKDFFNETLSK